MLFKVDLNVLRRMGNTRKPLDRRGKFLVGTSIRKRPSYIKKREGFGHWEIDTVVSSRENSKGCLATFV